VRWEKVAQSLIKGPILIFEAFPCFTIPIIVEMNSNSIKIHILLDSEAFACFMDKDFVDRHKLPLVTKKHPIPVEVIDGRPLVLGDATHETTPLNIVIKGHHSIIAFNVIKSPSNLVIYGSINITQLLIGRPEDWLFSQTLFQYKNLVIKKFLRFLIINKFKKKKSTKFFALHVLCMKNGMTKHESAWTHYSQRSVMDATLDQDKTMI
jgi:hypothetical protein